LAEEGIEVVRVAAEPVETLAARLAAVVDDHTAAVLCSSVLFQTARIVPGLLDVGAACKRHGVEFLIDAYHHLNVVPFDPAGLEQAFVVGGGYKYCQLGEGVCFLRIPKGCLLKPVLTGWFAEFDALADADHTTVMYPHGAGRFAGATFDPTSFYRAASVFEFFKQRRLTPELLREVSQHQVQLLAERFDALVFDPAVVRRDTTVDLAHVGGFLVLWSPHAEEISRRLKERGVLTDHRGEGLRVGPAPYLSDAQLKEAIERLREACGDLGGHA
jgi:hypothetical protein